MKRLYLGALFFFALLDMGCGKGGSHRSTDAESVTNGSCPVIEELLKKHDADFFSQKLSDTLDAITLGEGVDHNSYASKKYPFNVSVAESFDVDGSKEDAKHYYSERISDIANRIASDPEIFLSDFITGDDKQHWTIDELLAKKKILNDGSELSLGDAIEGSVVKIDVLSPVTKLGFFTKVSNSLDLSLDDNKEEDPKQSTEDALDFFKNGENLKGAISLWDLAVDKKDYQLIARLSPLLSSDAAALNQIVAESEAVRQILRDNKNLSCYPVGLKLSQQISTFAKRTLNHTKEVSVDELSNPSDGLIQAVFNAFNDNCPEDAEGDTISLDDKTKTTAQENLLALENTLKPIIENSALDYLRSKGVDPKNPLQALSGQVGICPTNP